MEHYNNPNMGENWFSYPQLYKEMLDKFPSGSHFVEIGSWKGKSAAFMAVEIHNSGKSIKFDCIDIWEDSPDIAHLIEPGLTLFETFERNISPVRSLINPIRSDSVKAAANYADGSLDFVFIDGDHSYEGFKRDLQTWLPKMKPNGSIIAGHDYGWDNEVGRGIRTAVEEVVGGGKFYNDPWGGECFILDMVDGVPVKYNDVASVEKEIDAVIGA